MSCSAKKTQRYVRIVASYLSAEKQHAKMIRTMTELGRWLWSHHSWRESTAAVVPLAPEGQRPQGRRHLASRPSAWKPVLSSGRESVCQVLLVLELRFGAPELKWPLLFPAVFQEEARKELRSESKLRVGHKSGWKGFSGGRRLPAARRCFLSASSLFHSVTGRRRLAAVKPVELSVCLPLSIHESGNTSVCDESEPDVLVKVGQTPFHTLNVTVSSRSSSAKRLFFLQTPEDDCVAGRGKWTLGPGGERGRELDAVGALTGAGHQGRWSRQGWAVAPCTVNTSTHVLSHSHTLHAAAEHLFKVGCKPPEDAHSAWVIVLLES